MDDLGGMPAKDQVVFPMPEEDAIDFIVLILVMFEDKKREEAGESPMTDEERQSAMSNWKSYLKQACDVVVRGSRTAKDVLAMIQDAVPLLTSFHGS